MSGTAEHQVASLTARYLPDVQELMRTAIGDDDSIGPLLRYHLGWEEIDGSVASGSGGKSLRPVLCLAACHMAGGDWRMALPAAAALELVHNFSLIHDDIQDGDSTRRGRATLWSIWGTPKAVTAGNAMRVIADQAMRALHLRGISAANATNAAMELTRSYLEMIEGQYLDMSFETTQYVSVDAYLDMIGRKTGALIQSAMYIGAMIATGKESVARTFGECGRSLGLAFQVRDDYLGVWGNPNYTGKPVGSDIRRKKKSLPTVYLFDNAPASSQHWLNQAYAAEEIGEPDLAAIMVLLAELEGRGYVQEIAKQHAASAITIADGMDITDDSKASLAELADFFVTRNA